MFGLNLFKKRRNEIPRTAYAGLQQYFTLVTAENYRGDLLNLLQQAERATDKIRTDREDSLSLRRDLLTLESTIRARLKYESGLKKQSFSDFLRTEMYNPQNIRLEKDKETMTTIIEAGP